MVRILNRSLFLLIFCLTVITFSVEKNNLIAHVKAQLIQKIQVEYPEVDPKLIYVTFTDTTALDKYDGMFQGYTSMVEYMSNPLSARAVNIKLHFDDKPISKKVALLYKATATATYVRLNKTLKRNSIITDSDLELYTSNVLGKSRKSYHQIEDVIGLESKYLLAKGSLLTERNLQKPPVIHSGDIVSLVIYGNGVMLKIKGKSVQDGALGETIKVKSLVNKSKGKYFFRRNS